MATGQARLRRPPGPCRRHRTTGTGAAHPSAEFEALARRLEVLLNRYGDDHYRLAVLYHQAMELELRFFDAAVRWEKR